MVTGDARGGTGEDDRLAAAALRVVAEHGWEGLTLERVAAACGRSRPTLWRQGVTRDSLVRSLLTHLAGSYRSAIWPVMTMDGTGADRLRRAMESLYAVADDNLVLLGASDTVFHLARQEEPRVSFIEPLTRLLRDGAADGTLNPVDSPGEVATVLFNSIWTYVHLRRRHDWSSEQARTNMLELLLRSISPTEAEAAP